MLKRLQEGWMRKGNSKQGWLKVGSHNHALVKIVPYEPSILYLSFFQLYEDLYNKHIQYL